MSRPTHLVDMLLSVWQSLDSVLTTLSESQWKTMTECPGWTVQDTVSHLLSSEKGLHGDKGTDHRASDLTNVKNPIGEFNEHEVDARRHLPGSAVMAEWTQVQAKRREMLTTAGDDYFTREMMTPTGPGTFADFMHIRVMDAWIHEQDVRRVLNMPGNQSGPAAEHSIGRFARSLPMVVAKRAKAPDGSLVSIRLTGPVRSAFHIATTGARAALVDQADAPTCTISLDSDTYIALCCGRQSYSIGDPRVTIEGDTALAERILTSFNVMI